MAGNYELSAGDGLTLYCLATEILRPGMKVICQASTEDIIFNSIKIFLAPHREVVLAVNNDRKCLSPNTIITVP